jgi:hypothetical protein
MSGLIKHQMQPCPVSCVSTCIAMVAGIPAAEAVQRFHKRYREDGLSLRKILNELGIPFTSFDSADDTGLTEEGAYLCTAPSLNIVAGTHEIVIEVTGDDYFVIDPVMGREDRKFYVKRGQASGLAIDLGGFTIDAFISAEWLKSRNV